MRTVAVCTLATCHFFATIAWGGNNDVELQSWHQWRGPLANGVAPHGDPPVQWSEQQNVAWKVRIPGQGTSTPIVWADKLFLLASIKTDKIDPHLPKPADQPDRPFGIKFPNAVHQFVVQCLDRRSGETLWQQTATETIPHEGHHDDNTFASASPTTDGQRLFAWFGSAGLFCYDLEGELLWKRDLGKVNMRRSFGEGCSPVVHGNRLIVNRDSDSDSYVLVLDVETGETVWKVDRDEDSAWATPLVVESAGTTQVITNASNRVRSYDLASGKVIWECGGQVGNVTPCPVTSDGLVYCMSGYRGNALLAIPLDSKGDITGTDKVAWTQNRGTPYVPSPLLYDGLLYFNQSNNGILTCVDAKPGRTVIERTRMPDMSRIYASPVGAAGRVYFVSRDGVTLVLKRGSEFKVMATNRLDEGIDASPAIVGKQLFLRGRQHLYCIAE